MVQEGSVLLQTGTGQDVCRRRREGFRRESFGTFLWGQVTSVVGGCMLLLFHAGKSNEKHAEKIEAGGLCFCYFLPGDDPPERGAGEMRKTRFSFPSSVVFFPAAEKGLYRQDSFSCEFLFSFGDQPFFSMRLRIRRLSSRIRKGLAILSEKP